jgi:AcrR family transcriptional regulator
MNKRSADDSKKKILQAARTVFAEYGYVQTSMRTIALQAGISVGGLYLYFKNKEELYLTFMQEGMNDLNDRMRDALCTIEDPVEAIRAFIDISIDFAHTHKEMIILQGRELGFSFGGEFKREFSRERRKMIEKIIREGMARGVFRSCDATETSKVIFNMLRGFVVSMVIDEESLFTPEECARLVLHGLLRRNDG